MGITIQKNNLFKLRRRRINMRGFRILSLSIIIILAFSSIGFSQAKQADMNSKQGMTFYVNDPVGRNSVTFTSTAPLEDIVGTTSDITGYMVFDPANPDKGGHGEFQVSVASINTGVPNRNEHMKGETWLDAQKYPYIKLKISNVKEIKKTKETESSVTYDVVADGEIIIKGKTQPIEVPGRITYLQESEATQKRLPGNLLAARASFNVRLADFGIPGEKAMSLIGSKVGENITIDVRIMGSTGSEAPEMMEAASK
jgi:polyisoprenoid-binding protein YceI